MGYPRLMSLGAIRSTDLSRKRRRLLIDKDCILERTDPFDQVLGGTLLKFGFVFARFRTAGLSVFTFRSTDCPSCGKLTMNCPSGSVSCRRAVDRYSRHYHPEEVHDGAAPTRWPDDVRIEAEICDSKREILVSSALAPLPLHLTTGAGRVRLWMDRKGRLVSAPQ